MKKVSVMLCFLLCILCCGCVDKATESSDNANTAKYGANCKITAEQAKELMSDGDAYILLDVRTDEEFKESHIDGAVLIPDDEINARTETELPDKNARILIYCRSGRRSANVLNEMISMGYTCVYDFGGIIDWPYETVSN